MKEEHNLIGKKYNKLTVEEFFGKDKHRNLLWKCKCDCGNYSIVRSNSLITGSTKSCGRGKCSKSFKNGLSKSSFWNIWQMIKQRCNNKNYPTYKNYGGKGIIYNPKWEDFENFKNDMYNKYTYIITKINIKKPKLKRIDINKNFTSDNCYFE